MNVPNELQVAAPIAQPQVRTSPQHLLVTLLGDYWYGRQEHLPSAAIVRLLEEFDVSEASGRAALSRLMRRGLLESSKIGRRTYYGLTAHTTTKVAEGARRVMAFGVSERPWDEGWTIASFSVPEEHRDVRHLLRSRLRWLGFAPLFDGVWVSPHASLEEVSTELAELEISSLTVARAQQIAGPRAPISAWDLEDLREAYDRFITETRPLVQRVAAGDVGAAEALVARTKIMDAWRTFPSLDPDLPQQVLPTDWPRTSSRAIFGELYDALGPLAEIRVQQVVGEFAPDLVPLVGHHNSSQLIGSAALSAADSAQSEST